MSGSIIKRLVQTSTFKTDFKKIAKSGRYKINDFKCIVEDFLMKDLPLPEKYKDHPLIGVWKGYHECHIKPDWLLIYQNNPETLTLVRTGSHSELFN